MARLMVAIGRSIEDSALNKSCLDPESAKRRAVTKPLVDGAMEHQGFVTLDD
jgi:hypothetical protein